MTESGQTIDVRTTRVFDGRMLRATLYGGGAPRLFVSFDYREPRKRDFGATRPIERAVANGFDNLHVQTARNDWYLNRELPALRKALKALTGAYRQVVAFGSSQGGYGVLLLSRQLRINRAILNSPLSTPFPGKPPFDTRYHMDEKRSRARFDLTPADVRPQMNAFVLVDPRSPTADLRHARLIAAMSDRVQVVPVPFGGHPCGATIREAELWGEMLDALMGQRLRSTDLAGLRRRARAGSPRWRENSAAALAARASRNP